MTNQRSFSIFPGVGILLAALSLPAGAADEALFELLDALRSNNSLTTKQYEDLLEAFEDAADSGDSTPLQIESEGGLELGTYDGEFSFEFGGRLMVDLANYAEDEVDLGDGTELRRARFEAEGTLYSDWGYELGFDFAGGDADVKDAYIEYRGYWPTRLLVGQFKEPFSLEESTSSRYTTFMERALINEFAPGHHIGLGVATRGEGWTAAGGVFGGAFDDDVDDEGDEAWSLTGRATWAPWRDDRKALHFGASLSQRDPDDEREVKYNARPESHITDVKYLNTDDIGEVDAIDLYGLEFALVRGPWSLQAEYVQARVDRRLGLPELNFDGYYVYASWFLTGESRIYKPKKGAFGRINPTAGGGAWELAVRLSELDLNDEDIDGGAAKQLTLGVNWYVNPHTRFMFNYVRIDNDDDADDAGDVAGDDDPAGLQLRAQIDF